MTNHILKTGVDAVIQYGGKLVPCVVTAVRHSHPLERFQQHKTVRITVDALDLCAGDVLTSQAGPVFPLAAMTPNCDQGFRPFTVEVDKEPA